MLNTIPVAYYSLDLNGNITLVNPAAERFFGMQQQQMIGKNIWELFPDTVNDPSFSVIHLAISQNTESVCEYLSPISNTWIRLTAIPGRMGIVVSATNIKAITARKTVEQKTAQHLENLQAILDTTLMQMSVLEAIRDDQGKIVDFYIKAVNKEMERMTGRDDLQDKKYGQEYPGIFETGVFELIVKTVETGQPQNMEYFYQYEGFKQWFASSFVKLNDGVVGTNMDITQRKVMEEERMRNLTLLQQSEDIAQIGNWDFELGSGIFTWSEGMYRLFDLEKGVEISPEIYLKEVDLKSLQNAKRVVRLIRSGKTDFDEILTLKINGQKRVLRIKASVIRNSLGQPVRVVGVDFDITAIRDAEEKIRKMEAEQQLEIIKVTFATQEEERRRISESLHNGLGQLLFAIKIGMTSVNIQEAISSPDQFDQSKAYTESLLVEAIQECRKISHELMPATLEEFGLRSAIDDVCKQLSGTVHFDCHYSSVMPGLEKYLELAVFRTVQELMLNVVKHAGGTHAEVIVAIQQREIHISVKDNGRGIGRYQKTKNGIGLAFIRSKAKLLNGTVDINSIPGAGTEVIVNIPFKIGVN